MRTLRDGARRLKKLHRDLHPPTLFRRAWKDNVFARESLGDGVEVELWYLAEHFLLAWRDWHSLCERFPKYFGESADQFPETWSRMDSQCSVLAKDLLRNGSLEGFVLEHWLATGKISASQKESPPSIGEIYHLIVQNHRRWSLVQDAKMGRLEPHVQLVESLPLDGPNWPRCQSVMGQLNDETFSMGRRWAKSIGKDLFFHLRHYRRANLLVSWLNGEDNDDVLGAGDGRGDGEGYGDGTGDGRGDGSGFGYGDGTGDGRTGGRQQRGPPFNGKSALMQLSSEKIVIPSFEQYLSQLEDPDVRGASQHVLQRITQAIGEIGFNEFVDDVSSSDFHGGAQSLVGVSSINLIPSHAQGRCHLLLLAVSRGDKKAIGFSSIMRQVREHLINCAETKAVIVLCDHWHPGMLDEHIRDLRAHHKRCVRFLFLMAGLPGQIMAPVAVDLGLPE